MSDLEKGILMAVASTVMIFATCHMCFKIVEVDRAVRGWAAKNGFRIINMKRSNYSTSFSFCFVLTVLNQRQQKRDALIRVDWWMVAKTTEDNLVVQFTD